MGAEQSNVTPEHAEQTQSKESKLNVAASQPEYTKQLSIMSMPNPGAAQIVNRIPEPPISNSQIEQSSTADRSTSSPVRPLPGFDTDQNSGLSVWKPLAILDEAEKLERHLEIRKDKQGRVELSVKPEVRDSAGNLTIRPGSPGNFNRLIKEKYVEALHAAAESEPSRKQALAQIDQRINVIAKELQLKNMPSIQDISKMDRAENLAKLTPAQRQTFEELKKLLQDKNDLHSSSLKSVEDRYEKFLERTEQTGALALFRQSKHILETLPFQNWLNESGKLSSQQSEVVADSNPFYSYRKAVESMHENPPNTHMADIYFKNALRSADKLDSKILDTEIARLKCEIKAEKEKGQLGDSALSRLESEERALILLKASPGLIRIAYADFLINSNNSDQAFRLLAIAADNPAAIAIVNKNSQYYEQLVDRSLHGDKGMINKANQALGNLQGYNEHFARALDFVKANDKHKAKEEFEKAYQAAKDASSITHNLDTRDLANNVKLFDTALRDEKAKPLAKQNQEKLKALEEQRQYYQTLLHLPALAELAQAKVEVSLSFTDGKRNTDKDASVRELIARTEGDPTLYDMPGLKEQVDYIKNLVHSDTYGEMAWNYLRRNSGSIVALGVGFTVAGLTCWSGPGAAFAGAAAAGAVAGTMTDWACGNEVSLASFGGHCLEGGGGGLGKIVVGKMATSTFVSRIPGPFARPAIGAAGAGTTGAVEHLPDLILEGPGIYVSKVGLDIVAGSMLMGPRTIAAKKLPAIAPIVQSPGLSHIIKAPAENLSNPGSK